MKMYIFCMFLNIFLGFYIITIFIGHIGHLLGLDRLREKILEFIYICSLLVRYLFIGCLTEKIGTRSGSRVAAVSSI